MQNVNRNILPRIGRGTTTLGLISGKDGIPFCRNMKINEFWAHHSSHRGKTTCVELGPVVIEF